MKYSLHIVSTAEKQFLKFQSPLQNRIKNKFKKLSGSLAALCCAKTFSFRVLYQIAGNELLVWVVAIDNRKDIYR